MMPTSEYWSSNLDRDLVSQTWSNISPKIDTKHQYCHFVVVFDDVTVQMYLV